MEAIDFYEEVKTIKKKGVESHQGDRLPFSVLLGCKHANVL